MGVGIPEAVAGIGRVWFGMAGRGSGCLKSDARPCAAGFGFGSPVAQDDVFEEAKDFGGHGAGRYLDGEHGPCAFALRLESVGEGGGAFEKVEVGIFLRKDVLHQRKLGGKGKLCGFEQRPESLEMATLLKLLLFGVALVAAGKVGDSVGQQVKPLLLADVGKVVDDGFGAVFREA